MLPNLIMAETAVIFLIVCVVCAMSEGSPSDKASSRNFFRSVRVTLREIPLIVYPIVIGLVIYAGWKIDAINFKCALLTAVLLAIGAFVLNDHRILCGRKKARKKKKRRPLRWLREVPMTKEVPELKEPKEAPLARELPEREVAVTAKD